MFNVISELHQKAVNHAKEIYLILKTDPIYGGIFLWRILYEIQIRTGFFANKVSVHKSFDQAQKYAKTFLIHSELRSRKRILECTTITKKEKKELKDIARRLDELNKNNKEQKLARFDSDYGWTGFQSFKDLENLNISNQENLFQEVGFEQELNRFKQDLSLLKKMFYLANDIGHSNSIIDNHLFTLLDQSPVNFMVYSQPLARYCLIIFTSNTLAMISSNCLYSLLGNKVDMGYNNFLFKTLNKIEREAWNAALQQAQDRTLPEFE